MTRTLILSLIAAGLALGGSGTASAQMMIENRDLLSPGEREIYHERMGNAGSQAERDELRTEHSDTVRERASTRGTDMSQMGRSMKDADHGHDTGPVGDGGAHGKGIGGSGAGHQYGPGSGDSASSHGGGHAKGKGKKGI